MRIRQNNVATPKLIVLAGANGSGKSTSAPAILAPSVTFLNADDIAGMLPELPSQKKGTTGSADAL